MPVEEIREENKTQLDEDTVDREIINDSTPLQNTSADDNCNEEDTVSNVEENGVKVCEDVRYDKYFKMKQFGVPAEAVKLKMFAEGLDPSLLE